MDDAIGSGPERGHEHLNPGNWIPADWQRQNVALRRIARSLLGDAAAADDVVQGAWLRALEQPRRVRSFPWMARTVRHRAIDEIRRQDRHGAESLDVAANERADGPPDPAQVAQSLETYRALVTAVEALSEGQRLVVHMRYFEGLGPMEIADRLAVPVSTVKKRLERALAALRDEFRGGRELSGLLLVAFGPGRDTGAAATAGFGSMGTAGVGLMTKWVVGALVAVVCGGLLWTASPGPLGPVTAQRPETEASAPSVPLPELDQPAHGARRPASTTTHPHGATAPEPPASHTALSLKALWQDGSPAVDLPIVLSRMGVDRQDRPWGASRLTDAQGEVTFEGLTAGAWRAKSSRRATVEFVVQGQPQQSVVLHHEGSLTVRGRVVDPAGRAVPLADVWLSVGWRRWSDAEVVATTDNAGEFVLEHMDAWGSLGAFARGFAPSEQVKLQDQASTHGEVVVGLQLLSGGAGLTGRVLGPDGRGVPGAWLVGGGLLGAWPGSSEPDLPGGLPPRTTVTDDQGRYEYQGLPSGEWSLCAFTEGGPLWHGAVSLTAGETRRLDVQLSHPAVLTGVVRDGAGRPLEGVVVRAFDEAINESAVPLAEFYYYHPVGAPTARSNAQGEYRLEGLWPGRTWVYALEPVKTGPPGSLMRDQTTLDLAGGGPHAWNPTIEPGATIRGRATYADGRPITRPFVTAKDADSGAETLVRADQEGRFEFFNLAGQSYSVEVHVQDRVGVTEVLEERGVAPSGAELMLVAKARPEASTPCVVRGRVEDAANRIDGKLDFELQGPRALGRVWRTIEGRTFEYSRELPGRHRLVVLSGEHPIHITPWFEVEPGEDFDLGTVVTKPRGAVAIALRRSPGTEALSGQIVLENLDLDDRRRHDVTGDTSSILLGNAIPGRYRATVQIEGLVDASAEFAVLSGQEAAVDLELRRP